MNTARDHADADRPRSRDRRLPHSRTSSIPTPITPRWSPTPIWCCRTRPISSARTASRCSTGRSASADGAADAIRQPVRRARPRRAAVPGRADRSRRAAQAAGPRDMPTARRNIPASMPTTSSTTSAGRASARWPAGAAPTATSSGSGAANPRQLERYIAQWLLLAAARSRRRQRYFKHANRAYLDWAVADGLHRHAGAVVLQLYSETLQKFRLAAQGHGAVQPPDRASRSASPPISIRCRSGIRRSSRQRSTARHFRCMPSPSGRWRCITPGARRTPGCGRSTARTASIIHRAHRRGARHRRRRLGLGRQPPRPHQGAGQADGGRQSATRSGPGTPSASARAPGTCPKAPEATRGFLLNHLISRAAAGARDGYRYANADPVTGQAAWYDLRVRIEKAAGRRRRDRARIRHARRAAALAERHRVLRYGAALPAAAKARHDQPARRARRQAPRPRHRSRHLRRLSCLRRQLQGMEQRRRRGAADRSRSLRRRARSASGSTASTPSRPARARRAAPCISRAPACIATSPPASPSVPPAPATSAPRTASCWSNEELCIGCKLCSWACPYGAREFDEDAGVMKKCTLCIDSIYNETLDAERPRAGLRRHLPGLGAAFRRSRRSQLRGLAAWCAERGGYDLMPELGYAPDQQIPAAAPRRQRGRHRRRRPSWRRRLPAAARRLPRAGSTGCSRD